VHHGEVSQPTTTRHIFFFLSFIYFFFSDPNPPFFAGLDNPQEKF